jgi:uncharacterized membrane-anchored protein YitT (DUF2179 family)
MKQIKSGILLIAVGSVIYGCAVGLLLNPNGIVTGGVSGLAVILGRFVPLGVGTLTVLLNIPLLILGRAYFGRRFFGLTLLSILLSGGAADFTSRLTPLTQQPLPCAVAGGIFIGVGCGLVFRGGATTGGVDIAAKVLRQKKPHIRTGHAFLLIDGFICVLSGIFSHSFDNAVYSFFALGTFSKTLDFVLYGSDEAKSALIWAVRFSTGKGDIQVRGLLCCCAQSHADSCPKR